MWQSAVYSSYCPQEGSYFLTQAPEDLLMYLLKEEAKMDTLEQPLGRGEGGEGYYNYAVCIQYSAKVHIRLTPD